LVLGPAGAAYLNRVSELSLEDRYASEFRGEETTLGERERALIREVAEERVSKFPPLTREQASLVRGVLTGRAYRTE
jgi:hypothetical protein